MPDAYAHVDGLRAEARDEIKRRIEQRDKYSVQLTVALSALVGVAFSNPMLRKVLIAAPLLSIYFTVLILYSYSIHDVLAEYLRTVLEPRLSELAADARVPGWETWYKDFAHKPPGIRRAFFVNAMWIVTGASILFLYRTEYQHDSSFASTFWVTAVVYIGACVWITRKFRKRR